MSVIQQVHGLKAGKKVNQTAVENAVKEWKEHGQLPQKIELKPITIERILIAMLGYAAEEHQKTGVWNLPTQSTTGVIPDMEGENWGALDVNGRQGTRGLKAGMTLAIIQQLYGLKAGKQINHKGVEKAVHDWKEYGRLPEKIEVKPITVEQILISMLEFAENVHRATGVWTLPTEDSSGDVPLMEGRSWNSLTLKGHRGRENLEKGMSLAVIQKLYGLKVRKTVIPQAVEKAVRDWKEKGILPDRIDAVESGKVSTPELVPAP